MEQRQRLELSSVLNYMQNPREYNDNEIVDLKVFPIIFLIYLLSIQY